MAAAMTIEQSITEWLEDIGDRRSEETHKSYAYALRAFQRWLAEAHPKLRAVDELNAPLLKEYVTTLLKRKLDTRTLHQYVGVLTRWLQALIDAGELPGIINQRGKLMTADGVRSLLIQQIPRLEPAVAPRVPDLRRLPAYYAEQFYQFMRARADQVPGIDDPVALRQYLNLLRNQALIATLFSSGGRINEVLSLDAGMVKRRGAIQDAVRIRGKGRKERPLRLNQTARTAIAAYLESRAPYFEDSTALFISHGPRGKGQRLSDVSAWKVVKEAAEALADLRRAEGAPKDEVRALLAVGPHALRHYLAQAMLDEGADYKDLTAVLGHSSAVVTEQFYARLGDERVLEVIETFAPEPAATFRTPVSEDAESAEIHDTADSSAVRLDGTPEHG
jgi:site-specific recombinase XerD